jgi:hypothetical protein
LAAGPNNPFALLEIVDCMSHVEVGGKKDAPYIANMILPLIQRMEKSMDEHNKLRPGGVDLVLFDGMSNVFKSWQDFGYKSSSHHCSAWGRA